MKVLCAVLLFGAALFGAWLLQHSGAVGARSLDPRAATVLLSAGQPDELPAGMTLVPAEAGGQALCIPEDVLTVRAALDAPRYRFRLARPAEMALWVDAQWNDGCGNSIGARFDEAEPFVVGNDGTYRVWHWVFGGRLALAAGEHVLALLPREDGLAVDQILLTSDSRYHPSGAINPDGTQRVAPQPAGGPAVETIPNPRPYRAAVAGAFRGGFESVVVRLGLPCDRLRQDELSDVDKLRRYNLLCVSLYQCHNRDAVGAAVEQYVRDGGTLVMEFVEGQGRLLVGDSDDHLFRNSPEPILTMDCCVLKTDAAAVFRGFENQEMRLVSDVVGEVIPVEPKHPATQVFGVLSGQERHSIERGGKLIRFWRVPTVGGGAVFRRPFGKGVLYRLALPPSFHGMWRGPLLDGILANVILDAVGDRGEPLFARVFPACQEGPGRVLFADDFMREGDIGPAWRVESGAFRCTGEKPANKQDAFSLRGEGPGVIAAAANPDWRDYRLAASLRPGDGRAGLWVSLSDGRRVGLVLDGARSKVLLREIGPVARTLAEVDVPQYGGWRRLSLCCAEGELRGAVDGEARVSSPCSAGVCGVFGLVVEEATVLFDDVAVRPVSDLPVGTDRAPGEEGSCRARSLMRAGSVEARDEYSMQWLLRPSPDGARALVPALPNYVPGLLRVDGREEVAVPASADGARVALPGGRLPRKQVEFFCPGWRDYVFSERMTDWYSTDGDWGVVPRWVCDQKWEWLGVDTPRRTVLWHKAQLAPPYTICALMAVRARDLEEYESDRARDLDLVVSGDGKSLDGAYCYRVMRAGERGCELWRGDKLLARAADAGLPRDWSMHHVWFEVRADVEPKRIRLFLEGRPVIDHVLDEPIPPGHVGVWTEDSAIAVARVTLSVSR